MKKESEKTEMRCYGLSIPGSDHRFFLPTLTPSVSLRPTTTVPVNRLTFGSSFPKLKATFNDGVVTEKLSFYDLLGIPVSGSLNDIKSAYKQLARKYHPDVSPPDRVEEYTKKFIQVHEAYETLSDPSRRIMYDQDMARGVNLAFNARKRYNHSDQVSVFLFGCFFFGVLKFMCGLSLVFVFVIDLYID